MKRPPWHQDLLAVAALPAAERVLLHDDRCTTPSVVVFVGAGAWERARLARREMLEAEEREWSVWRRLAEWAEAPTAARPRRRWAVTCLPPGESPWAYDWRAALHQVVVLYSCDADETAWLPLRDVLLSQGAARVEVFDGRQESPRPHVGSFVATRKAA